MIKHFVPMFLNSVQNVGTWNQSVNGNS